MNKPNLILLIAFIFVIVFVMALTGCSAEAEPKKPVAAAGAWNGTANDVVFEAVITENKIVIHIVNDDTKALYWQGTFGVDELSDGDYLKSTADTEALDASLMGSGSDSKEFKFLNGTLNFDFEVMGVATTVKLSK